MIEVAICDDSIEDISELRSLSERFAAEYTQFPIKLRAFCSPAELLAHIDSSGGFDLYILDVVMPRISGIQLAEKIRSRGETAEIIFLTFSREYAVDAFAVRASGYLLKPVSKTEFDKELLHSLRKLIPEDNASLIVKTKDGLRRIQLQSIVMIESFDHTRVLTLSDGSVLETPAALSEIYKQLSDHNNFCMPHRAYIANLNHTMGIRRYELIMLGDKRIPIPKKQYSVVHKAFSDYFLE